MSKRDVLEWLKKLEPGFYSTKAILRNAKRRGMPTGDVLDALREWDCPKSTERGTNKITWIVRAK